MGYETIELRFFLFGGGVERGGEGVFLGGEILFDHGWMDLFCSVFITAI